MKAERSGSWKQNLHGELAYKSFIPAPLPPRPGLAFDEEMAALLLKAHQRLAYLEGKNSMIPDLNLFVSMYVRKEALLSSQIEGTQATLEDVLDPSVDENTNRSVADVINYIKATEFALKRMESLPLCGRLIRETHAVLMRGVRGQEKTPGKFRISQNWIGGSGCAPEDMATCMSELEKYINDEGDETDALIKAALIHYQFETIHPFLDGNGRVGRLLITLYLLKTAVLTAPALYVSYFLKKNRIEYYDRMSEVRRRGDYEQWVKFFLRALCESAEDAISTIDRLSALHLRCIELIGKEPRNQNMLAIFSYLEKNPIIEINKTSKDMGLAYNTVARSVSFFIEKGLLEQKKRGRTRIFHYSQYLAILRKDTENLP